MQPYTVVRTVDVSCNSVNSCNHSFVTALLLAACEVQATQVDRVLIEETEADDAVFGRLDLIQSLYVKTDPHLQVALLL